MITAELITEVSRLAPIAHRWRELAVLCSNAFITPEWFHAWWTHQGQESTTPLISVARRPSGEIAGVMPLVIDKSSRPRAIRFAGASIGDRFHPAAAPADEAEVAAATAAALEDQGLHRQMMLIEHAESDAPWCQAVQESTQEEQAMIEQSETATPYIDLRDRGWDEYLASRSKNFRKQVRRAERSLLDRHGMEIRVATPDSVTADLTELFRLHDLRLTGFGGSSLGPDSRRSLEAFAVAAAERGWLRLKTLEADGRPVAAFLGWRVGDTYASYQGGFDPDWSRLGVGFGLEAMTVRDAIDEGAAEYDFLLGTEPWKRRFTDQARPSQTLVVVGARNPVRLLVAAESGLRRAGRGVTRRPALTRLLRAMRGVIPTSRRV